ncbi:hypothetical protein [Nocardioides okcheonensis]|uniref:hypothetical protein n=1 Tax=Nocardioides okcheonensis TaxID=2894081 RepID=UPI001E30E08D|nr:hypothetical protein [Nocardioides okcheonensis]UFN46138.1 hypothetical protein LN652_08045 [Nocardioides okcheonensis]
MIWITGGLTLAVVVAWLDRRQRRRDAEDRARPGLPARSAQPRRGVGHLGEAPVTVHHRLGGASSRD